MGKVKVGVADNQFIVSISSLCEVAIVCVLCIFRLQVNQYFLSKNHYLFKLEDTDTIKYFLGNRANQMVIKFPPFFYVLCLFLIN